MIVVADTSPINYLILIDEIRVLESLYSHVRRLCRIGAPSGARAREEVVGSSAELVGIADTVGQIRCRS